MSLDKVLSVQSSTDFAQFVVVSPMKALNHRTCSISNDKAPLFKKRYAVIAEKNQAHIAELPGKIVPVLVDVDMAIPTTTGAGELYTDQDVSEVAAAYTRAIVDTHFPPEFVEFALLTKAPRMSGDRCKHGFHMHSLNAAVESVTMKAIFNRARLHLGATKSVSGKFVLADCLDDVTNKPWLLYGSTKGPNMQPFVMTKKISVDTVSFQVTVTDCPPLSVEAGVELLSLRVPPAPTCAVGLLLTRRDTDMMNSLGEASSSDAAKYLWTASNAFGFEQDIVHDYGESGDEDEDEDEAGPTASLDFSDQDIKNVVDAVCCAFTEYAAPFRSDDYNEWFKTALSLAGWCLDEKRIPLDVGFHLFNEFSKLSPKYNSLAVHNAWEAAVKRVTAKIAQGARPSRFRNRLFDWRGDFLKAQEAGDTKTPRYQFKEIMSIVEESAPSGSKPAAKAMNAMVPYVKGRQAWMSNDMVDLRKQCEAEDSARTTRPLDVLRVVFAHIADERFEDDEMIRYMVAGAVVEVLLGRVEEAACLATLCNVFAERTQIVDAPGFVRRLWAETMRAETSKFHNEPDKCSTMGRVFAMAAIDSDEFKLFDRKFCAQAPSFVTDTKVAMALTRWWPSRLGFLEKFFYEFKGTTWNKCYEMTALLKLRIMVWGAEIVQRASFGSCPGKYSPDHDNEILHGNAEGGEIVKKLSTLIMTDAFLSRVISASETFLRMGGPFNTGRFEFDGKRNLVAFRNVVFDSDVNEVRPGRFDDYLTAHLNCSYIKPEALNKDCVAEINAFMESIHPRKDKREYFLNSLSHIFAGSNPWKQYMIWTGEGHNGKSVCVKIFEKLLARHMSKLNKAVLIVSKQRDGCAPNPDLVRMKNARMVVTDEVAAGDMLNSGSIKLYSGNDTFTTRDLYARADDMLTINPAFIPIIVCNDLPSMYRPDRAAWARLKVFRFESKFVVDVDKTKSEIQAGKLTGVNPDFVFPRDEKIISRLTTDEMLDTLGSMLLHRYIEVCRMQDEGIKMDDPPQCVTQGESQFRISQNIVHQALSKRYSFRSPFTEAPLDDDPTEEQLLHEERMSELYNESISLREMMQLIEITSKRKPSVNEVIDAAKEMDAVFAPFVRWDEAESCLRGLKLV